MDDFSDDGFDELNVALLQELETKALRALQPNGGSSTIATTTLSSAVPKRTDCPVEAIRIEDDFNQADAEVLRELARVPTQHSFGGRLAAAAAPPPLALPAYSQQNLANVPLPAATSKGVFQQSTSRAGFYASAQPRAGSLAHMGSVATRGSLNTPAAIARTTSANTMPSASDSATTATLQARILALETDLNIARGKASMMQEKYEKAMQSHGAEIARVQRQKDEELAKQRHLAEVAVAAQKTAAIELEFARRDLKEELEKSKAGRRAGDRDRDGNPTTPRKGGAGRSNWKVADGFDDIELLPSPSKGRRLRDAGGISAVAPVDRTPTKGKRRRLVTDSPTKPLEVLDADADFFQASLGVGGGGIPPAPDEKADQGEKSARESEVAPFVFLQEVLSHQCEPSSGATIIELFSRYCFPSNRRQTLGFLLLQRIPTLEGSQGATRLMLDFCHLVLGIWSQCLREQYFAPMRALVELMSYVLGRDPSGLAPHIQVALVPLAQETIYLLDALTANVPGSGLSDQPDYARRQRVGDFDTGAIVSLLRLTALGCLRQPIVPASSPQQSQLQSSHSDLSTSAQASFWSLMQFEFFLMMLSSKQPPEAFLGMLSLLRTSALPDSIGPITNDPEKDAGVVAFYVIDRISHHIKEPPKWTSSSKYTEWGVRLSGLGVLDCFAQSPFGKLSLAASNSALPRLVDVLFQAYSELRDRDVLAEPLDPAVDQFRLSDAEMRRYVEGEFDFVLPPGSGEAKTENGADGADPSNLGGGFLRNSTALVLQYISATVSLLHSIATDPLTSVVANIPAKLAEARGGTQYFFLMAMARIGFRADPAFDIGLNEETHQCAYELFKLAATPDEDKEYLEWTRSRCRTWNTSSNMDPFASTVI